MHITGMAIRDVPPISDPIVLMFDERVNVLAGPNASGKSAILRWMQSKVDEAVPHSWLLEYLDESDDTNELGVSEDWLDSVMGKLATYQPTPPPVIFIGPTRIGLPRVSELTPDSALGSTVEEVLSGPFCGARLHTAIELLYDKTDRMYEQEQQAESPANERRAGNLLYVSNVAHACVKSICDELITRARAFNYPTGLDVEILADQPMADLKSVSINRMLGVATNDIARFDHLKPEERPIDLGGPSPERIYVGDLSSGSQSTLLWVLWLALKMLNHYEFAEGWSQKPAILLIDEIENHLHPTWQRRVIPALLEHFPGLQIFATTHSPFVVAGLKAGQVHLLNRDENGVVTATTNTEDIVGWTADEILRTMMGVQDPTDDETARNAAELRQLRDEGERADEREEAERQKRMQQLRRLVDRDLLAGGPKARRREEFARRFREAMERQRQEEELNQDNG